MCHSERQAGHREATCSGLEWRLAVLAGTWVLCPSSTGTEPGRACHTCFIRVSLQLASEKSLTYLLVCVHAISPTWTAFLRCHPLLSSPS